MSYYTDLMWLPLWKVWRKNHRIAKTFRGAGLKIRPFAASRITLQVALRRRKTWEKLVEHYRSKGLMS